MHCIKEFTLSGIRAAGLFSAVKKLKAVPYFLTQLGCVLLLGGSARLLHCTDAGYWLCQKKGKKKNHKNKAMLSHLYLAFKCFFLCSFASYLALYFLYQTKPWACVYTVGLPTTQTHKHKPTAGLNMHTNHLCVSVSPPGWEINTSHQPSV